MPDRAPLDKQTFLAAVTCRTQGWRARRRVREEVTAAQEWQWHTGNQVQQAARLQLGDGILLQRALPERALADTAAALAGSDRLLFEATAVSGGCVARADALRRREDGWDLIECKSSTCKDDGKLDPAHLDDIAYTTMVCRGAGIAVTRATLMLVDPAYRLGGGVPLLREIDVTAPALARAAEFAAMVPDILAAVHREALPEPVFGFVCRDCDFFAVDCVGTGITDPVFQIPRLLRQHFEKIGGPLRLADLPAEPPLTETQLRYLAVHRAGVPLRDEAELAALDRMTWPLHYLDFEAAQPAVPWFAGDAPYELLPFQYSMHRQAARGGELEHLEYLAHPGGDWRPALIDALLRDLGDRGSIVVYSPFEKTILGRLASFSPAHAAAMEALIARLADLEPVIRKGYQHPDFKGRTSIKVVLPVMAPELGYDALAIGDGLDAAAQFALMQVGRIPADDHPMRRRHLLEYCGLDTFAMVRVHQELERVREAGGASGPGYVRER